MTHEPYEPTGSSWRIPHRRDVGGSPIAANAMCLSRRPVGAAAVGLAGRESATRAPRADGGGAAPRIPGSGVAVGEDVAV